MRRLHLQIFLTIAGAALLFGLLASMAWWLLRDREGSGRDSNAIAALQAVIEEALPAAGAPLAELERRLARIGERAGAWITLRAADGALIVAYGEPLPDLHRRDHPPEPRPRIRFGQGWTAGLSLADGRRVIAQLQSGAHDWTDRGAGFLGVLLSFVVALALAAYPLARRLTRRLERLEASVERLGAGDLGARVEVHGRDEVAALARSFNRAAERIEALVAAQKRSLATASHELRTPLGRLRMALELIGAEKTPGATPPEELKRRATEDIAELDALIEELLLASRLDAAPELLELRELDLLGLAAEEAARFGAEVSGEPCLVNGDERLLRRLIRNLLDNARRHGDGAPAEIAVTARPDTAVLSVRNLGPSVPEDERERIFEPFYRRRATEGLSSAERSSGAGLGLHLVRQIARRHGGDARCLPEPDGVIIEVTLARGSA